MLTDARIRQAIKEAEIAAKPIKRFDVRGLFVLCKPNGSAHFRFKYRYEGREKLLSLGVWPDTTLGMARDKRDEMRRLMASEVDPSVRRKAERSARANTVKEVANEWVHLQTEVDAGTRATHEARLRLHVFPRLGNRPIASVTASELLDVLRRIEKSPSRNWSKLETAKRVRQLCGQIWRYAVSTDRAQHDIAHDLRDALATPKVKHLAAVIEPTEVGALLRAIWEYAGSPITMAALKMSALTAARPGEVRHMEWGEIDYAQAVWKIPKDKMKRRVEHWVPLSVQALDILREIQFLTGSERRAKYVFPGLRTTSRPMSENTVNGAIRRLGYQSGEQTAHGFRTIFSTMSNDAMRGDERRWSVDAIEAQLSHTSGNAVRAAYNRANYLRERRLLMQWFADELDSLRVAGATGKVLPFVSAAVA